MKKNKNIDMESPMENAAPAAGVAETATPERKPKKPRKKLTKGKIALIVIGVLAVLFIVYRVIAGNREIPVPLATETVSNDDIEVVLNYSGNVSSSNIKTYYSVISAPVSGVELKVGDRVKTGDLLISYDPEELNLLREKANLTSAQSEGNYSSSLEKNAKATVRSVGMSLTEIENRMDEITAQTDALNALIQEKTARMQRTLTDLQKTAMDVDQNNVSDSTDAVRGDTGSQDRITDDGHGKQMSLAVQEAMSEVQYALQYDPEILAWKDQINALSEEKSRLAEAASAESARLTSGDKEVLDAQRSLSELDTQSTLSDVEEAEAGITSEFNGVVTELNVQSGATVAKGSGLITVASTDDTQIDMAISKADIGRITEGQLVDITIGKNTYTGKVTHIAGSATKNANGVPVVAAVITIDNPDDSIILGTEASLKIHTDHAEGVPVVPYEFIGADSDGDYVYTIGDDSRAVRVNVTIGLSTGTMAEITEGLKAGDVIIAEDPSTITEGMLVTSLDLTE